MEYNQYWNEIKSVDDDVQKNEQNTSFEEVVSFDYNVVPEEPVKHPINCEENSDNALYDEDDADFLSESENQDDSEFYSNSSLFELIDEMEDAEDREKESRPVDSRFISFEFNDKIKPADDSEDNVHIFADGFGLPVDEDDIEEPFDDDVIEPESSVAEPVIAPEIEPAEEITAETKTEPQEEIASPQIPHFESPVFEDKEETDIDSIILEAKKKEEEKMIRKQMEDSELLPLLKDIISFMPANCAFSDYILKLSKEDRKDFVRFIDQAKAAWMKDGSEKLFTIADGDLSICILSDASDPMSEVQRLNAIGAQMFSYEKASWNVVKLYFDNEGRLLHADTQVINKDSFNSWQWKIVQTAGFNLWKSRQQ